MKKGSTVLAGRILSILVAVLAGILCHAALATEVYTWTDKDGVLHFSDTKPAAIDSRSIKVDGNGGRANYSPPAPVSTAPVETETEEQPLSAAQQLRRDITESRQARIKEQAEREQMCSRHQKRLEQMEPARRVYYVDENGEQVRMDDIQRVTLIEESRDYLAENCN